MGRCDRQWCSSISMAAVVRPGSGELGHVDWSSMRSSIGKAWFPRRLPGRGAVLSLPACSARPGRPRSFAGSGVRHCDLAFGGPGDSPLLSGSTQHLHRPAPMASVASSCAYGLGGDSDWASMVVRRAWRRQVSALAWGVSCAVAVVGLALVMARRRSLESHAARIERASRPAALQDAKLVYMERPFRISTSVGLVAKVDRAYLPVGSCWWSSRRAGATSPACRT